MSDKSNTSYEEHVAERLSEVFDVTREQPLDLDDGPIVLVSDLHKGSRDGADDFWRCERAYHAALGYYLAAGYRLFVLGDVEELWECWPGEVIDDYRKTLQLEAQFHDAGRYQRLWGNHDDLWKDPEKVHKHLHSFYKDLQIHEALKFRITARKEELGILFLVHGHQGTSQSDSKSPLPRMAVRYIWRNVQRITKKSLNTPATDHRLRQRHNTAMFKWAKSQPGRVVVAGHTHKPVFAESWPTYAGGSAEYIEGTKAALELIGAQKRWRDPPPLPVSPPCYFNTGCCAFADGDITAIEVTSDEFRLVRWLDDDDLPQSKELAKAGVHDVFSRVN